ncbi:MAG: hypothetical protein IAB19_10465 [Proteobacteria bacterium]|uniref:Uncharacterized protein n=1 Tax=Candidatus Avisuccinivibrio stercorigallinarum TaxID=2840704 RepID=A0A9D9DD11_9GAMM|nr:hypothetical protein [Candidatus Avisuccinivibrio stercorigallinarum]
MLHKLIEEYGGYCFDPKGKVTVCTPWNVMLFLSYPGEGFRSYWTDSGGFRNPYMVNWLRQLRPYGLGLRGLSDFIFSGYTKQLCLKEITRHIESIDTNEDAAVFPYFQLLLQTGYFTIKERISSKNSRQFTEYVVGVPNKEVLDLFKDKIVEELTRNQRVDHLAKLDYSYGRKLRAAVRSGNIQEMQLQLNRLINIFPSGTLHEFNEANLTALLRIILHLLDFKLTNKAKLLSEQFDLAFENTKTIYLLYLKVIKDCSGIEDACNAVQEQHRQCTPKGSSRSGSDLTRKQIFKYVMVIIRDPLTGNDALEPEIIKAFRAVAAASYEPVRRLVLLKAPEE